MSCHPTLHPGTQTSRLSAGMKNEGQNNTLPLHQDSQAWVPTRTREGGLVALDFQRPLNGIALRPRRRRAHPTRRIRSSPSAPALDPSRRRLVSPQRPRPHTITPASRSGTPPRPCTARTAGAARRRMYRSVSSSTMDKSGPVSRYLERLKRELH